MLLKQYFVEFVGCMEGMNWNTVLESFTNAKSLKRISC